MSQTTGTHDLSTIDYGMQDHPGPVAWSEAARREIDAIFAKYPDKSSATLPILWLAVREFGWISYQVEMIVAEVLERPLNEIHQVVTFYTMYPRRPLGRHHIQLCRNISCWLSGAVDLREHIKQILGIEVGETTPDGRFTLSEVECLAYCECAPAMRFDDTYIGNLTKDSVARIIRENS
ncbi:MAG TPA: NAD(P)H-dependent oxidoreductase subunit E [bacterium]|nr:NAD(P)H-dependent oxidoreductase subunit E [bacterium]